MEKILILDLYPKLSYRFQKIRAVVMELEMILVVKVYTKNVKIFNEAK